MVLTPGPFPPERQVNPSARRTTVTGIVGALRPPASASPLHGTCATPYGPHMKRLALILATTLALALAPAVARGVGPTQPRQADRIEWLIPNWFAGVQMATSNASAADPYLHAKFKRVGGEGQRQVRMGERHKIPGTHRWGPYHYQRAVKLLVGQKVVFTTKRALPCEPEIEPIGITLDMRVKMPGKAWTKWVSWIVEDDRLLDCTEGAKSLG